MNNTDNIDYAADQYGRPDASQVPGTGVATGPGTLGGVHASELGNDRSGTKTNDFTSGIEGTPAAHSLHNTGETTGRDYQHQHHQPHSHTHNASVGGRDHVSSGRDMTSTREGNPLTSGNSPNESLRSDATSRHHHGSLPGAVNASSVSGHHQDGHNTLGHNEHGSRSSVSETTPHGLSGQASHSPSTSNAKDSSALGGVTATPQQQTMAGHKDPSVVAASQPTTHETGSMLDIGDVPTHSAHHSSSHKPTHTSTRDQAGLDPVGHKSSSHTGRDGAGMAAAGAAAAYGAHHHNQHHSGSSASQPTGSGIDPAHSNTRDGHMGLGAGSRQDPQTGLDNSSALHHGAHSTGHDDRLDSTRAGHGDHKSRDAALGLGAAGAAATYGAHEHDKHSKTPETSSTSRHAGSAINPTHADSRTAAPIGQDTYHNPQSGHADHKSRDAALGAGAAGAAAYGMHEHNKHKGQDASAAQPVGSGVDPTHRDSRTAVGSEYNDPQSGSGDHFGRDAALAGAGAAGAGYSASRLARHHNEPSIGQRSEVLPEDSQRTGLDRGTYGQPSTGSIVGAGNNATHASSPTAATQGQYNTLPGGTPSGIAVNPTSGAHTDSRNTHGVPGTTGLGNETAARSGNEPYSSLSSGSPSGMAMRDQQSGLGSSTRDNQTPSSYGQGSGVGTGLKANAASAAEQLRSTGRVTHQCQNCHEDMDISKHFLHSN
ncbi:hypothetical protein E8E14_010411 [Neopestalotiopsis sp. 37M]|nr:hypothetical protein E8E14_010411 [Neopestalotiopsis sp. 37M]